MFDLDTGALSPVQGIPPTGCVRGSFRMTVSNTWLVLWRSSGTDAEQCSGAGRAYLVNGAGKATEGLAFAADETVVPGDNGSLWKLGPDGGPDGPRQRVQRMTPAGRAVSPVYQLPVGWTLDRGLTKDVLLLFRPLEDPADNWQTWQPSTGHVLRRYQRVIAADAHLVVWTTRPCGNKQCSLRVDYTDADNDFEVALPRGENASGGSISSDRKRIALVLADGATAETARHDSGYVLDLSTRSLRVIKQLKIPGSASQRSLGIGWASPSWLVATESGAEGTRGIAAYDAASGEFVASTRGPAPGAFVMLAL